MVRHKVIALGFAILLTLAPAAWSAEPPAASASVDCALKALFPLPQSSQAPTNWPEEALFDSSRAQNKAGNCCTNQDWNDCVNNLPQHGGCWIEVFYCYQNQFCYCGYNCP